MSDYPQVSQPGRGQLGARNGLGRVRAMSADYARSRRTLAQVNAMVAERGGEAPAHLLRARDAMAARLAACEEAWDALGSALEHVASSCCPAAAEVVRLRCCEALPWGEVARGVSYSVRQAQNLYNGACRALDEWDGPVPWRGSGTAPGPIASRRAGA